MKKLLASMLLFVGIVTAGALVPAQGAMALDPFEECTTNSQSSVCASKDDNVKNLIGVIVNTLLFIVGAAAVLVIIIGGIMFVTSAGNQQTVATAKNAVLYAIIGLVVSFLAYAIVNWVFRIF
ncbi:MAG TPA: pilin [Candidatus Saccharibacteria bacterium]|nr:pilin [Candidatus Saccharibacteria bacterium]